MRVGGEVLHTPDGDGLEQRILHREVAVDGPGPDAGAPGDLVERHGEPDPANASLAAASTRSRPYRFPALGVIRVRKAIATAAPRPGGGAERRSP